MAQVRELIEALVRAQGTNLSELSRKIGRNHAYLQQYVKRGIPRKLDEADREKIAQELGIPPGSLREDNVAQALAELRNGNLVRVTKAPYASSNSNGGMAHSGDRFVPREITVSAGSVEMPLYRFAHGGTAAPILENDPFEKVVRPDYLARVRDPYGVMVEGTSMIPEYQPGWIAHIDPNLTPRSGDTCVFRGEQVDGTHVALIKVLCRETTTHWYVEQHNPPRGEKRQMSLKKSDYQVAHVTTGTDKRRR